MTFWMIKDVNHWWLKGPQMWCKTWKLIQFVNSLLETSILKNNLKGNCDFNWNDFFYKFKYIYIYIIQTNMHIYDKIYVTQFLIHV